MLSLWPPRSSESPYALHAGGCCVVIVFRPEIPVRLGMCSLGCPSLALILLVITNCRWNRLRSGWLTVDLFMRPYFVCNHHCWCSSNSSLGLVQPLAWPSNGLSLSVDTWLFLLHSSLFYCMPADTSIENLINSDGPHQQHHRKE